MPILIWEREQRPLVPYCLLEHSGKYGNAPSDNLLLQGDNLAALKALLPHYAGQIKCVFIDPPYNIGKAFKHYNDNLEHSQWLDIMYPRLILLRNLLANNGSIWVTIDDDEAHYLKVIMDEIFGRKNFVANVIWQKKHTRANDAGWFSDNHDHILVYAKNKSNCVINLLPCTEMQDQSFSNHDNDPRGDWALQPIQVKTPNEQYIYEIKNTTGKKFFPPKGCSWQFSKEKYEELVRDNRIWFDEKGTDVPQIKKFISEVQDGLKAVTIWSHAEVGHNQGAKKEAKAFNSDEVFDTPKPEKLIQRILHLATKPGDLVLDSFLGSGTTAAVAHKMQRRWIGIEMGEHAQTHCIPRLQKVIDGEQGGISTAEKWTGGGGFYFMTLGNPIFNDDGNINPQLDFAALAAHIWFYETKTPLAKRETQKTFLGEYNNIGYALLYNGIIKDKSEKGHNALTSKTLKIIRDAAPKNFAKKIIVYGNSCCLQNICLQNENLEFRQIPFSLKTEEK